MQVTFMRREELAPGIWQHYFRPERPVQFQPGQYVELQLPYIDDDPRGSRRTFTLTSLPSDPLLSFVTKDQAQVSPYKATLGLLEPTDQAIITDPMGDLVLPKSPDISLVFIAGGIGIASYVAMLKQLLAAKQTRDIRLYYSLRWRSEQIFGDITDAYDFTSKQLILSPARLNANQLLRRAAPDCLWYISGSQQFVEELQHGLEANGISREYIIFDYYDGYADL